MTSKPPLVRWSGGLARMRVEPILVEVRAIPEH